MTSSRFLFLPGPSSMKLSFSIGIPFAALRLGVFGLTERALRAPLPECTGTKDRRQITMSHGKLVPSLGFPKKYEPLRKNGFNTFQLFVYLLH